MPIIITKEGKQSSLIFHVPHASINVPEKEKKKFLKKGVDTVL